MAAQIAEAAGSGDRLSLCVRHLQDVSHQQLYGNYRITSSFLMCYAI